jgi:multiple sugar transport system ATP-binding protein
MAHLRLNNVTKIYDKNIYAVKDITFEVNDKEFAVLVGPSGCGKTTMLRLIAGLEQVSAGEIMIDGQCVNEVLPKDRDIAMVFQNYALYPHMTVYDNIAFGLKMRKYPKKEIAQNVDNAVDILGIRELLDRKPKQLSGGQRQRVAVGRAIVRQPKLFLFDEPLSNLDAKLRVQMRAELSRLHKRLKATIVYVTHDQIEAMTLGEKIAVINDGEIQQIADPETLYKRPKNKFIAGFIGSPPMNFITGTIHKDNGSFVFRTSDLAINLTSRFEQFLNQDVILGIRPTDFNLEKGSSIEILVDVTEPMGNEVYIYGRCGETMLSARIPEGVRLKTGQRFTVKIQPDKLHLFDIENEEALI